MAGLLGLFVVAAQRYGSSIQQLRTQVLLARDETETTDRLLLAVTDAETGQRGFLLTMRPDYLTPYWTSAGEVGRLLGQIDALAGRDPWLRGEADALRGLIRAKMDELDSTIAVARSRGQVAALAIVMTDTGKAAMDAIRVHAAGIVAHSDAERDLRIRDLQGREQSGVLGMMAAALVGVLLLGTAWLRQLVARRRLARARDALRLQWERLQATVDRIRDGVAVFDAEDRLLLWNAAFFPSTELPGTLARQGTALAEFAAAGGAWSPPLLPAGRPAPGGAPQIQETRQGLRVLEVWRSALPDGGQMLAVADISRRTQAEMVARQAHKMEALGQLTGGVAHDFNNLLQIVSANLELLGARLTEEWQRTRLGAALAGVERGARLTRHLLAFARRQPLAPEAVDPARLLGGLEDMLRGTLGAVIKVELVIGGGLWAVHADPAQLETAVLNLAINARDAMPDGGRLTIEAGNASLDAAYAAANEVTPGQYVMIAVTDTGVGMSQDQLVRAVEPFYTTKPEGRGTGLGLSMVYGFARQSGGHFKLYSEPGHGTTARLYIPRATADAVVPAASAPALPQSEGELVLVVEDDAAVRAVTAQSLRDLGYRTMEAESGEAALDLLRGGARPDLLFTDVVMPGRVPARLLAQEARRLLGDGLAVVFTSGYTENAVVHNGQLDRDVLLVSKPWRVEELGRRLHQALDGARRPAGPMPRRVLLVEDEPLVRMTTADTLAAMGHEVAEAASGAEALRLLAAGADLMVADLGLPDMDGIALTHLARRIRPGLPVVIASGSPAQAIGVEPPVVWLEKPYDEAALAAALARLSGGAAGRLAAGPPLGEV
ncbi:MAG: CHASE3 domain-containing protein [Acidisphaera sp.]|nr:CHASE3 domain-containing protein [Acidisphaera sp.]